MGPILLHYLWVKRSSRSEAEREARFRRLHAAYAPVARQLVGELRGMFAKVAQVASVVPEALPEEYQREFKKLQDTVPPASWDDVRRVLEADLGGPLGSIFESIQREPLGSASLGQAHLVTYRGQRAVVKVQYPDSAANIRADFDSMQALFGLVKPEALPMIRKVRKQFEKELDYRQEASHLRLLHDALAAAPEFRDRIAVPAPIPELTRGRVLGMEYLPGPKLDSVLLARHRALGVDIGRRSVQMVIDGLTGASAAAAAPATPSPARSSGGRGRTARARAKAKAVPQRPSLLLRAGGAAAAAAVALLGPDRLLWLARTATELRLYCKRRFAGAAPGASSHELRAALRLLLEVHGYQMFFCPVFNADPHPGNILALPDGRVGLIDLGQCVEFDPELKTRFARLLLLLAQPQDRDSDAKVVEAMLGLGIRTEKTDHQYLAFLPRLVLCKMQAQWFKDGYYKQVLRRDRIVEQPLELMMVTRTANLLRGFGFMMLENVSLVEAWSPWAERWLAQCGGRP